MANPPVHGETVSTLTGSMADHRLAARLEHMLASPWRSTSQAPAGPLPTMRSRRACDGSGRWIAELRRRPGGQQGPTFGPRGRPSAAASVHAIAYAINAALGNLGKLSIFGEGGGPAPAAKQHRRSGGRDPRGTVKTLVILGQSGLTTRRPTWAGRPAKTCRSDPPGLPPRRNLGPRRLQSPRRRTFSSPGATPAPFDGTIVPIQPMILPLFGGLTEIEILAGSPARRRPSRMPWSPRPIGGSRAPTRDFQRFLHDGVLADSAYPSAAWIFNGEGITGCSARGPVRRAVEGTISRCASQRLQGRRRPLRQQRLVSRNAGADDQDLLGQCDSRQPEIAKELGIQSKRFPPAGRPRRDRKFL